MPRLLDLFCGQGGAAMGYARAGFEVVGVDIVDQLRYPFEFARADAFEYLLEHGHEFDAIHASPPCQAYTLMTAPQRGSGGACDGHQDLVGPTRAALKSVGVPWVMENVVGAPLVEPWVLSGEMFGLGVDRPRLFESSVFFLVPRRVRRRREIVGVYGERPDGRRVTPPRRDGTVLRVAKGVEAGGVAMGVDWMDWKGLTQAVPPAYTEYLGRQLMALLAAVV